MKTIVIRGSYRQCGKTLIADRLRAEFPHVTVADVGDQGGKTDEAVYTLDRHRENEIVICIHDDVKDHFPLTIKESDPFFMVYRCNTIGRTLGDHETELIWSRYPTSIDFSKLIEKIKPFVAAPTPMDEDKKFEHLLKKTLDKAYENDKKENEGWVEVDLNAMKRSMTLEDKRLVKKMKMELKKLREAEEEEEESDENLGDDSDGEEE